MTLCPYCGSPHDAGSPCLIFGTPVTEVFGLDLAPEPTEDDRPPAPATDDVTAILGDYHRLLAKEARAREIKAAEMRRYRRRRGQDDPAVTE